MKCFKTINLIFVLVLLDISDDQKEMIELLEHMCSLTALSQKACHKILLYFKISCVSYLT